MQMFLFWLSRFYDVLVCLSEMTYVSIVDFVVDSYDFFIYF